MEYEEGIIVRTCIPVVNSQSTFQGTVRVMKSYTYYSRLSNYINNIVFIKIHLIVYVKDY